MKKIILLVMLFLTACAAPASAIPATAIATITPAPTSTITATKTETPIPPATVTETAQLSPDAMAAWDKLDLQDQWHIENIAGYGNGFVRLNEAGEREEVVVLPITFSDGQGKTTIVNQLCYKSQTQGKGLMTVLTCMSQKRDEHRLVKINGTDADAMEFFKWASNNQDFINGNSQLLAAMQAAAKGEKPLVIVQGDIAGVPADFLKFPEEVMAQGLKAEGMPFGANVGTVQQGEAFVPAVNMISPLPFGRDGKNFAMMFQDFEDFTTNYLSKGNTKKMVMSNIITLVLHWGSNLTTDGSFISTTDAGAKIRRLVQSIPTQLEKTGIDVEMAVLK